MSGHKFRIGSTSYVYPADLEPNVRQLAGVVDDVELVLFDTDGYGSNIPDPATISALNAIARDHALTFTVHLPVDIAYNDPIAWGKVQRAVDATRALHPFAYVAHLEGRALIGSPSPQVVSQWQAEAARALDQAITFVEDRQRICIENVERWEPEYFRNLVADAGVQRCIDIGHWWVNRRDALPYLYEHLAQTRVIHLHGVDQTGQDHQSLRHTPAQDLQAVLNVLADADYQGVLTLEVFGQEDFFSSLHTLQHMLQRYE